MGAALNTVCRFYSLESSLFCKEEFKTNGESVSNHGQKSTHVDQTSTQEKDFHIQKAPWQAYARGEEERDEIIPFFLFFLTLLIIHAFSCAKKENHFGENETTRMV
jgi:hypothetical protein